MMNEQTIREMFASHKPKTDSRLHAFAGLRKVYEDLALMIYYTVEDGAMKAQAINYLNISFLLTSNGLKVDEYRAIGKDTQE